MTGPKKANPSGRSRGKRGYVKTARGRKSSSTRWLQRQLNDPFVAEARRLGYRSRAAFKLTWLDDKFHLLRGARNILDLGAAPGGWTQVAVERTNGKAQILGIDLLEIDPINGAELLVMDFMATDAEDKLIKAIGGPVDLVMSDLANSATGHRRTDQLRTMALAETALDFAVKVLTPGGAFVVKVLQGGAEDDLLRTLKNSFKSVRHAKPDASRAESKELYVVATGFNRDKGC